MEKYREKIIKVFVLAAVLFGLTLGLGIVAGWQAYQLVAVSKLPQAQIESTSIWHFLAAFVIVVVFIFFLSRLGKNGEPEKYSKTKSIIFKAIFIMPVVVGIAFLLNLWMGRMMGLSGEFLGMILAAILIYKYLIQSSVLTHNFTMALGLAGVGVLLGLRMEPWWIALLLIIFSVYDFIAVYKTKHMTEMAKEMMKHNVILGLVIPQKVSDFWINVKQIQPGRGFMILGSGDVAFPLLFCVSLIPEGVISALIVAIFSMIGFFVTFGLFIGQRTRKPIPALPPIAFFSIIGFLITILI